MTAKYYLRPGIGFRINNRGQVYVTQGTRLFQLSVSIPDTQLTPIIDSLFGGADASQLASASGLSTEDCQTVIDSFVANRWVTQADPKQVATMGQRLDAYFAEGTDAPGYRQNLAASSMLVVGDGLLAKTLTQYLEQLGLKQLLVVSPHAASGPASRTVPDWEHGLKELAKSSGPTLVISCGDYWGGTWETALSRAIKASPSLYAIRLTMEGDTGVVGPIISRESTACWECYQCHREDIYADTLRFSASLRPLSAKAEINAHKLVSFNAPGAEEAICGLALGEIIGFAAGTISSRLVDRIHYFNFTTLKGRQTDLIPSTRCPSCAEKEFTLTRRVWDEIQI